MSASRFRVPVACLFLPLRPTAWALLSLTLLAACSQMPPEAPAQTPTQAPSTQADPPLQAASVPDKAAAPLAMAAAAPVGAVAQPVSPPPVLEGQALAGQADPDSYAQRPDARALAADLARTLSLDPDWTWQAIAQARYKASATRLMMPAPNGTKKNWAAYRQRFLDAPRIKAGAAFWQANEAALTRAETQYGVPARVIAGVLGVETIYGRNMGRFRVLDVLTTLSLDFPSGRSDRSAFFRTELGEFLLLCREQGVAPESVLGSYAGAIGLPQFMPSSIRRFAVDFDGDGHIDLSGSPSDAIGSVGHYLAEHGWRTGTPAYFDITPPRDEPSLTKLLQPDIVPSFLPSEMRTMGATLPTRALNHEGLLALVLLENGDAAPTLIAGTENFYAITRYNQSSYYALAVLELGDAVAREVARQNSDSR